MPAISFIKSLLRASLGIGRRRSSRKGAGAARLQRESRYGLLVSVRGTLLQSGLCQDGYGEILCSLRSFENDNRESGCQSDRESGGRKILSHPHLLGGRLFT